MRERRVVKKGYEHYEIHILDIRHIADKDSIIYIDEEPRIRYYSRKAAQEALELRNEK